MSRGAAFLLWRHVATALCGALLCASMAQADGSRQMPAQVPRAYQQECAACHVAYPPGMLPAASWQRLLKGLDAHYGSDASLDPQTVRELGVWLTAHAGSGREVGPAPPEDRITRSTWFIRKHREIDPTVWRHVSVKSAANCAACHTGTERGRYDDDGLRVPPGLSPQQARSLRD